MKNLQATLFMVLIALIAISTTPMASAAAQKQLSEAQPPVASTQGNYPLPVIIIEIICPLPFGLPLL